MGSGCWWLALDLHMVGLLGLEPTDNHNGRFNTNQQQPEPKREGKGHSDKNNRMWFLAY